ncbi:MAG: hypothetical protein F6K50_33705, partial [Moorea sp. SIO3I7]|nr:hypothetical protein [Moorena sp. SIO3I7]
MPWVIPGIDSNLNNPFVVGAPVPPDRFVGRQSEILAGFNQISNRSNLAIWGGP